MSPRGSPMTLLGSKAAASSAAPSNGLQQEPALGPQGHGGEAKGVAVLPRRLSASSRPACRGSAADWRAPPSSCTASSTSRRSARRGSAAYWRAWPLCRVGPRKSPRLARKGTAAYWSA
eukprot:5544817-Lingulodinium_polyedra.AAC.1